MSLSLKYISLLFVFTSVFQVNAELLTNDLPDNPKSTPVKKFPREIRLSDSTIVIYQPQVSEWKAHKVLVGWSAVLVKPDNNKNIITGALQFSAATDVDNEARTVVAYNRKILAANFPKLKQEEIDVLTTDIQRAVSKTPELIPLDLLLATLNEKNDSLKSVPVSVKPPKIYYSSSPSVLVLFNGEPVFAPIENNTLKFAVNTNWDVFFDEKNKKYYLRHDKQWLTSIDYKGPWTGATKLPAELTKLPKNKNWNAVLKSLPAKKTGNSAANKVIVSIEPTELIVTDGRVESALIANTKLHYIKNTNSDLFYHIKTGQYYFLTSGRWFETKSLIRSEWKYADKLPDDFEKIPADHIKASVRSSIPGTVEARLAVLQAQVPNKATVNRKKTTSNVTYSGEPVFKDIAGTTLKYAVNTRYDVIQAGNAYYLCNLGTWFFSDSAKGPWKVATSIPKEIYKIPAESPMYHVIYVHIYDYTESTVTVGYTAGYHNMYISHGTVMYGTGYYYSPYWYSYPYYPYMPVYYPYYYPSYGVAAYYNPYTGTYGRGAYLYGPYGGYGRGASYNPETGRYSRGVTAWGSEEGIYARQAYNPTTGIYSQSVQSNNSYAHWGNSVVRHGEDWVKTSHYTGDKGSIRKLDTSKNGKAIQVKGKENKATVARNKSGDLFVGKDKHIYKRTENGWMKRDGQEWQDIDKTVKPPSINAKGRIESLNRDSISKNIEQLNRDANSRNYGNRQFNDFQSRQRSGRLYNGNRNLNVPRGSFSGGRRSR